MLVPNQSSNMTKLTAPAAETEALAKATLSNIKTPRPTPLPIKYKSRNKNVSQKSL